MSSIIARFSSTVVRNTSVTCSFQLLPKNVTTGVAASNNNATCGSSSTATPARRVLPNAATFACRHSRRAASRKNSTSFGFDPGQPPSM